MVPVPCAGFSRSELPIPSSYTRFQLQDYRTNMCHRRPHRHSLHVIYLQRLVLGLLAEGISEKKKSVHRAWAEAGVRYLREKFYRPACCSFVLYRKCNRRRT